MNDLARREMITWNSPAIWVLPNFPAEQPPGDDFVFAGSLAEAIAAARAAAGQKQVHVMGGADLIRQALAAGLVNELTIIIAPVTLGPASACSRGSANPSNSST